MPFYIRIRPNIKLETLFPLFIEKKMHKDGYTYNIFETYEYLVPDSNFENLEEGEIIDIKWR